MRDLEYNGKLMSWEPLKSAFIAPIHERLWLRGSSAYVILEPGDATRYEFIVTRPLNGGLVFQRLSGGDPVGTAVVVYEHDSIDRIKQAVKQSGAANPWTIELLGWWLEQLIIKVFR